MRQPMGEGNGIDIPLLSTIDDNIVRVLMLQTLIDALLGHPAKIEWLLQAS